MLLAREFIDYISRQIVGKMTPLWIETANPEVAAGIVSGVITEDLSAEDRLNEEVRDLLAQYADYMRQEEISYQEMFRKIKNQMLRERKLIRASGRDTGDSMKLSRDKINDLSHQIVTAFRKDRNFRLKRDVNDIRLEMVKIVTDLLMTEDKVDRAARDKVKTHKREIGEGTEEYDLLHKRYYADELKKLGIDLGA